MIQTECGIYCLLTNQSVPITKAVEGLQKQQHRGRDSFGISYLKSNNQLNNNLNNRLNVIKRVGEVDIDKLKNFYHQDYSNVLGIEDIEDIEDVEEDMKDMKKCDKINQINFLTETSQSFLGHVRYSTTGCKDENVILPLTQPILNFKLSFGPKSFNNQVLGNFSLAHNGNIPDSCWKNIIRQYPFFKDHYQQYIISDTTSDSILLCHLIKYLAALYHHLDFNKEKIWLCILIDIIDLIEGAFCLVIQTHDEIWCARDKYGVRPLLITKWNDSCTNCEFHIKKQIEIASENVAFSNMNLPIRDVVPGEIVQIKYDNLEIKSKYKYHDKLNCLQLNKHCVFEYIYFQKDASTTNKISTTIFRHQIAIALGKQIYNNERLIQHWRSFDRNDILMCGIPSSGLIYGIKLSEFIGLPYRQFLKKRVDYPWRTFILESNDKRLQACAKKYIVEDNLIKDKVIILVDDSIVRGNTISYLVKYIKGFQPKEIHLISASPPVAFPCHYGVDFPDIEELIINRIPEEDMPSYFGVASITYLQVKNLHKTELPIMNLPWNQDTDLDEDLDKELDEDLKKKLNKDTKNVNVNDIQHNMCSACFDGNYPF
jgi:amidophosphoribosyltransferase